MSVQEIIAEKHLGARALKKHPKLREALVRLERAAGRHGTAEKERIASIVELCFEYERERDAEEKRNILRTLEEISTNEPLELPAETIEKWEARLKRSDAIYARAEAAARRKIDHLLSLAKVA